MEDARKLREPEIALSLFASLILTVVVGNNSEIEQRLAAAKQAVLAEILRDLPLALQNLQRADHGGVLPARIDPVVLTPVSGLLQQLCKGGLVGTLCNLVDGTDITGNLGELLGLLTGGAK